MKISNIEKKYIDARVDTVYLSSLRELTEHNDLSGTSYDDILAALTVNQLLFENSSGEWELMQPEKIIQIELDKGTVYVFQTKTRRVTVSSGDTTLVKVDLACDQGAVYVTEDESANHIWKLPPLHGFIKIIDINNQPTLKLGDIAIELK